MGSLILAAMAACAFLVPLSILSYRRATAPAEEAHRIADCRHCSDVLSHPRHTRTRLRISAAIPGPRGGGDR
ncbi:hypothetical protein OG322_26150 [Streptomyces sp. NBC_01260]|uniref:hypothetical protein n=1 Tax=Streptomyces sp. NBC_01260 TaxID=2903801 RepID=UPI002E352E60|nr:hypothetical protein [Streptomyces sp. NBC_01260]